MTSCRIVHDDVTSECCMVIDATSECHLICKVTSTGLTINSLNLQSFKLSLIS